jgi:hypothetical protein
MKNCRSESRATPSLDFDALLLGKLYFLNIFGINAKLDINMLLTESGFESRLEL